MTRRWRMTALLALSFLAVPAARARAEDPEVQRLREELRKEIETNRKLIAGLADIQEIKNRLAELERRLDGLQGPRERVSRFGPPTATIRLENRLSVPATIIVDGIPYRLQPNERRDLTNEPVRDFTFEALVDGFGSLQPRASRTLRPGQVYTIFTYLP